MIEKKVIIESLQNVFCPKCGTNLGGAEIVPVNEVPAGIIAQAVCPVCKSESMVTIALTGNGIIPIQSDLTGREYKKFVGEKPVSMEELLDLHKFLKKGKIWSLLQQKEQNRENSQNS